MTVPREALSICNGGASVVTMTLSVTLPTCNAESTRVLTSTWTSTFSRVKCLNPAISTSTRYSPAVTLGKVNTPALLVCVVRVSLVPRLVSFTVAPETVAPLESTIAPKTVPNLTWADTDKHVMAMTMTGRTNVNSLKGRRCVDAMPIWPTDNLAWWKKKLQPDFEKLPRTVARAFSIFLPLRRGKDGWLNLCEPVPGHSPDRTMKASSEIT